MKYSKPPLSIEQQIQKLVDRGLICNDAVKAANYLSNISYYRLRAYTYPFQNNQEEDQPFITKITFEEIIDLYVFDRKLRLLIFDGIEKIEIALRTQIIYNYCITHGSHWHIKPELYRNTMFFANHLANLQKEIDRSTETFIGHYKNKYSNPTEPPCWMSLEVSSVGLLSKIFQNLKLSPEKKKIIRHFGLADATVTENWMHCFSTLRNVCAHHGRVWNRRLTKIKLPTNPLNHFLSNTDIYPNKLYATLCCIEYVLQLISPNSTFKSRIKELIEKCPRAQMKEMGFPSDWAEEELWR